MNVVLSILVVAGMLFGGGATVYAAQDDLPNEPLYSVKTWTEDLSLQFQTNQEATVNRLMELAQVRVQEMTRLTDTNDPIPDQLRLRLEQHVQQALQLSASMDDATLDRTLLQIRDRLQQQDRDMEQLQLHANQLAQPQLDRTREMLQLRLQLVDEGLANHEMFRNTIRDGFRYGPNDQANPAPQNGDGPQNGQPTLVPAGPNTDPGGPNLNPGGSNTNPGGPNLNPGNPNSDAGGNTNGNMYSGSAADENGYGDGDSDGSTNGNGLGGNGK